MLAEQQKRKRSDESIFLEIVDVEINCLKMTGHAETLTGSFYFVVELKYFMIEKENHLLLK